MRRTVHAYSKVALRAIGLRDCVRYFAAEIRLRGLRQPWQVQYSIQPDAAFHPSACPLASKLERFESDDERRNDIASLS